MRTPLALLGSQTRQAAHSTKMCCALGTFGSHSVFATAAFIFPRQADRSSKSQNHGKSNPTANPLPLTTSLSTICTTPLLPPHAGEFMHREDVQHVGKHSMGALQHLGLPMKHKDMGGWGAPHSSLWPKHLPGLSLAALSGSAVILQRLHPNSWGLCPDQEHHWSPHISPMLPLGVGSPQAPPRPCSPAHSQPAVEQEGAALQHGAALGLPLSPHPTRPLAGRSCMKGCQGLARCKGRTNPSPWS